ncbi:hypothetical protein Tco_0040230 [Tanacetum coccineum]
MSYNELSCYLCGDPLDGILYRRCSCGWCGNKLDHGFCSYCASRAENSFAYDPNPNSFDNSPNFSYPPPQPQFETYSCELCGNDFYYGYDCPLRVPLVYEPKPCYNQNFNDNFYPQNSSTFSQQYLCCAYCGGPHFDYQCQPINETYYEPNPSYDSSGFDQPQPPQDFVDSHGILQALNKMQEELEEIKQDRRKKIEDMSIEEMRHEQQLVDYKIKEITNDLGYKRFHGEKIDEEYEEDCEIRIQKLKQDFNEWGSEVRKKEQAYNEEQYYAARRRMLSIPFVDEDDYIPLGDIIARYSTSKTITPDLPIEEPDNSLSMGDEHLDTTPSIENLVPIPSEFEGISDNTSNVPNCDNLLESLINRDTSIVYSSKIDPILEEFADELAHIALIPPGFLEEVNEVEQEEKEFDLEDILQIQDIGPDQEGLISIDNSNNTLLELPEFESFHFDPSFPRPPPEPPDVEICLHLNPDCNFDELNEDKFFDPGGGEIVFSQNVKDDDSFTFFIRTFLPYLTYPEDSPLLLSTGSEDTIFDPDIST